MIWLESGTMLLVNGWLARDDTRTLELRIKQDHKVIVRFHYGDTHWGTVCDRSELNRVVREFLESC